MVCTLHGLPVGWALVGAKTDERDVLEDLLATTPALARPQGQRRTVIADKAYYGHDFEVRLDRAGIDLLRPPPAKGRNPKPAPGSSGRYDRSSSPLTTPSKANSTSNYPEAAPLPACASGSPNASWPSSPRSGTTTTQAPPSSAHWSPTTTDHLELII